MVFADVQLAGRLLMGLKCAVCGWVRKKENKEEKKVDVRDSDLWPPSKNSAEHFAPWMAMLQWVSRFWHHCFLLGSEAKLKLRPHRLEQHWAKQQLTYRPFDVVSMKPLELFRVEGNAATGGHPEEDPKTWNAFMFYYLCNFFMQTWQRQSVRPAFLEMVKRVTVCAGTVQKHLVFKMNASTYTIGPKLR